MLIVINLAFSLALADYPSTIAVNYYFERKRAFANGISAAGVGTVSKIILISTVLIFWLKILHSI